MHNKTTYLVCRFFLPKIYGSLIFQVFVLEKSNRYTKAIIQISLAWILNSQYSDCD